MRLKQSQIPLAVLAFASSFPLVAGARATPQPQAAASGQAGWDTPPPEYREVQRKGFRDGIEGARKDFDNRRPANATNRDEYRHPQVGAGQRDDYRQGFRRGYEAAMQHLHGR
jgi:hypothetical protein